MVKTFSEHRVVKPQRGRLYCKLIPEPVCGLSCAKASLPHANLSLISLNYSRQVCTLHITNKRQTHSHTLKPFREKKLYASIYFYFISKSFEFWQAADIPSWIFYVMAYFDKGVQFQMMNISVKLKTEMHIFPFVSTKLFFVQFLNCICIKRLYHWCDSNHRLKRVQQIFAFQPWCLCVYTISIYLFLHLDLKDHNV